MKMKAFTVVMMGLVVFLQSDLFAQIYTGPKGRDVGSVAPLQTNVGMDSRAAGRNSTALTAPRVDTLVVMSGYNGTIPLTWRPPGGGIQGYNVYRGNSSGGPYQKIANALTKLWYRDEPVINGTVYYYVVTAVDGVGESPYSPEGSGVAQTNGYSIASAWTSTSPTIDGVINVSEWGSATKTTITYPGGSDPVTISVMNDGTKLYLAVDDRANRGARQDGGIGLFFDTNHDRYWPPNGSTTNEGVFQSWWDGGTSSPVRRFANYYGVWPDSLGIGAYVDPPGVTSNVNVASGNLQYEASFDLNTSMLSLPLNSIFGMFVYAMDFNSGNFTGVWPQENVAKLRPLFGDAGYRWAHGPFSYGDLKLASAPAATPTATAASNLTTSSFNANWSSSTGASGYRLDVATDAGFGAYVSGYNDKDVGNVTTLAVTGLNAGTTYYYRVRAYNAGGVPSPNSNVVGVPTLPNAPTATAATGVSTTGFAANWSAVAGATGYRLDVATDVGFSNYASGYNDKDVGNVTTLVVTGLNAGTTYYYRVRAYNAGGVPSPNSNVVGVPTLPNAPTALAATIIWSSGFAANWSAVAGAIGYQLDVATDAGFAGYVSGYSNRDVGNVTTYPVAGLTAGTTYYYRVRSANSGGPSTNSNVITVATFPTSPNTWTQQLSGTTATLRCVDAVSDQVAWTAGAGGTVLRTTNGGAHWASVGSPQDTANIYVIDALDSNIAFVGTYVDPAQASLYKTTNGGSSWTRVFNQTNGWIGSVTMFDSTAGVLLADPINNIWTVYQTHDGGNSWLPATGSPGALAGENMANNVSCWLNSQIGWFGSTGVSVPHAFKTTDGGSSWSSVSIASLPYVRTIAFADNRVGLAAGGTSMAKTTDGGTTWTPSSPPPAGNGTSLASFGGLFWMAAQGYVFVSTDSGATWNAEASTGGVLRHMSMTGSYPNVHGWAVGNSGLIISYSRAGIPVPAAPTALAATTVSQSGFMANWSVVANATDYRLDVATEGSFASMVPGFNNLNVGSVTSCAVSGLGQNTAYYYRVRASNTSGTSSHSNVITVSTMPNAPGVPTCAAATSIGQTSFTTNWNRVSGATGYRLDVATDTGFTSAVSGYSNKDVGDTTAAQVTGLAAGTPYYYRVRGANAGGSGPNSNVIGVTTLPNPATATAATSIGQTSFTANWNRVSGATGYRLDVATDAGFTSYAIGFGNKDVGDTTAAQVTGLAAGTQYHYRVRATNAGGSSPNSNVVSVTTLLITLNAPTATAATGLSTTGFTANWTAVTGATGYRLDVATDSLFASFVSGFNSLDVGDVTNRVVTGLTQGTAYYYRVRGMNTAGSSGNSNTIAVTTTLRSYPSTYVLTATTTFTTRSSLTDYASEDYRLVGLPGDPGGLLGAYLDGQQEVTWEAYWDNGKQGTPKDYYVKYDGSATFQSTSGKAFWVLHTGDWIVSNRSVNTAPLDGNRQVTIPLTSGQKYNLITNPFDTMISWSSVAAANGINDSIRTWAGYGWSRADAFEPYRGYLFFNSQNKTSIQVPYDLTALPAFGKPSIEGWRVDVVATCGKFRDETTSLGVSKDSRRDLDIYEQRKPRRFASIPDVYFDRRDWDGEFNEFATDIRPEVGEMEVWEMKVRSEERKPVELEFVGVGTVPTDLAVYLVDEAGGRAVDLRKEAKYKLAPATKVTLLSVVVGKPEVVNARAALVVPREYGLLQNYPNPFNPTTTIPIAVPRESRVVLEIYNMLGQRVRTLYEGTLTPGRYAFEWDGKGDQMRLNATGVYVCSLRSGNEISLSRKIVLLR